MAVKHLKLWIKNLYLKLSVHLKLFLQCAYRIFISWPPKKRIFWVLIIAVLVIAGLIVSSLITNYFEDRAAIQAETAPVGVITAKAKMMTVPQSISAVGNMQAILSVPVSFDAEGVLAKVYVKDGQQIKQGQTIAALDTTGDVAQLQYYQANLALQQATYQRMLSIKDIGAVSQQMLDAQKASMQQAQAQVNQQQAVIDQKIFKAPFAGVLSNVTGDIGGYLAKGTAIATLVQEAPLYVQYNLPVSSRPLIELGQPVVVTSSAYPGQAFKGILSYVAPQANSNSGTMTLQGTIDNPDFLLLPGMFVSISQMVNPNRQLLTIPEVAVMTDIIGQYVFKVVGPEVRKIYVNVGESVGNMVPVYNGLNEGDTVVVAGQQKLNDQSPITIVNDPALVQQINSDTAPTIQTSPDTSATLATPASTTEAKPASTILPVTSKAPIATPAVPTSAQSNGATRS